MRLFLYGNGRNSRKVYRYLEENSLLDLTRCFIDRDPAKRNTEFCGIPVQAWEDVSGEIGEEDMVVITPVNDASIQIARRLRDAGIRRYVFFAQLIEKSAGSMRELLQLSTAEIFEADLIHEIGILDRQNADKERQVRFLTGHFEASDMKPAEGELRERQKRLTELASALTEHFCSLGIAPMLGFGNMLGYVRHNGFIPWDDDFDLMLFRKDHVRFLEYARDALCFARYEGDSDSAVTREWYKEQIQSGTDKLIVLQTPWITRVFFPFQRYGEALFVDLYVLDSYNRDYTREVHAQYVKRMQELLASKPDNKDRYPVFEEMVSEVLAKYPGSDVCAFGLDCCENYNPVWKHALQFPYGDICPPQEITFEGLRIHAVRHPENYLRELYGEKYMHLPGDCALHVHAGYIV